MEMNRIGHPGPDLARGKGAVKTARGQSHGLIPNLACLGSGYLVGTPPPPQFPSTIPGRGTKSSVTSWGRGGGHSWGQGLPPPPPSCASPWQTQCSGSPLHFLSQGTQETHFPASLQLAGAT